MSCRCAPISTLYDLSAQSNRASMTAAQPHTSAASIAAAMISALLVCTSFSVPSLRTGQHRFVSPGGLRRPALLHGTSLRRGRRAPPHLSIYLKKYVLLTYFAFLRLLSAIIVIISQEPRERAAPQPGGTASSPSLSRRSHRVHDPLTAAYRPRRRSWLTPPLRAGHPPQLICRALTALRLTGHVHPAPGLLYCGGVQPCPEPVIL